eukprot:1002126-Alexandrium_andersonii.AAC.1
MQPSTSALGELHSQPPSGWYAVRRAAVAALVRHGCMCTGRPLFLAPVAGSSAVRCLMHSRAFV